MTFGDGAHLSSSSHSAWNFFAAPARSTINHILDPPKIEAGQFQIETINFSLSEVHGAVKALIAEPARAKAVTITLDSNSVSIWLRGDPTRLCQALLNFASNAVKFTE